MEGDRYIADIWCHEVLALLSQHIDGELSPGERARVAAHVSACDVCARFGTRFARAIAALRSEAIEAPEPDAVRDRLLARLRGAAGR